MKIRTQLAIAVNTGILAFCGYLYINETSAAFAMQQEIDNVIEDIREQEIFMQQATCLAMNIYHEARSEGEQGQRAVAWATMNRVHSPDYPNSICEVVYQAELNENGIPLKNRCSYSWFCDGLPDEVNDQAAWNLSKSIAEEVVNAYGNETDPTNGSIMYHAYYVTPYWVTSYEKEARIDSHIFYK